MSTFTLISNSPTCPKIATNFFKIINIGYEGDGIDEEVGFDNEPPTSSNLDNLQENIRNCWMRGQIWD